MSRTTQLVSIPLAEGSTTVHIASTAWGVGGARIEDGRIVFAAGPDFIGSRPVESQVLVQDEKNIIPEGFLNAGPVTLNSRKLNVLVRMPVS